MAAPAVSAAPVSLPSAVAPAIATAGSATLPAGTFVLSSMLPLEEVHPASCIQPVPGAPPPSAAMAAGVGQQYDVAARMSSTGSQFLDSCMDVGKDVSPMQEAVEAAAVSELPAAAVNSAAAACAKVPLMQRAPRLKVKPRKADDPPRPLLDPSSPKSKKRAAGRTASHPSSGHCCTQCGAVVSHMSTAGPSWSTACRPY